MRLAGICFFIAGLCVLLGGLIGNVSTWEMVTEIIIGIAAMGYGFILSGPDSTKTKHEAAFNAYVQENPKHICHVVDCGGVWNPGTGVLIIVGGGSLHGVSVAQVFYICDLHDYESSVTVMRDGCTMSFNPVPKGGANGSSPA